MKRLAITLTACTALASVRCSSPAPSASPGAASAQAVRMENERMHQRLDELVGGDALIAQALASRGQVLVALRTDLAVDLVREVTRRYLDRVELDLKLGQRVHETGAVEVGTPLGRMKAGEWEADVVVHRVTGVLRAHAPKLVLAGHNRLRVDLPVSLERAEGSATVRFRWDARSLANVVCRDFEVSRTVRGRLLSHEYVIAGAVLLNAGTRAVMAQPDFPRTAFRLRVDLLPESWREVREAVREQDKLLRCGLGIDPDQILPRLSALLREGFDVRLPRSVFRAVDLPGSVGASIRLDDREVALVVSTEALEVTPEAVWYAVSVRSSPQGPS